jgi:hypothetical protein
MDVPKTVGGVIFVIVVLVLLYYIYRFLFLSRDLSGLTIQKGVSVANLENPIVVRADQLPTLFEGGEYTMNFWIYINDWSYRRGQNKNILTLGGDDFKTLAVFLGPYKNTLAVRVHSNTESGLLPGSGAPMTPQAQGDNLAKENITTLFSSTQQPDGLINTERPCDIPSVDLQKWVQVTVVLNNKNADVYMDGKLARSCVLPSFYKVARKNIQVSVCDFGGFGGFVSNISAYNYALNPEEVWRLYMSGPSAGYSIWEYIQSLFNPNQTALDYSYPKKNIVA